MFNLRLVFATAAVVVVLAAASARGQTSAADCPGAPTDLQAAMKPCVDGLNSNSDPCVDYANYFTCLRTKLNSCVGFLQLRATERPWPAWRVSERPEPSSPSPQMCNSGATGLFTPSILVSGCVGYGKCTTAQCTICPSGTSSVSSRLTAAAVVLVAALLAAIAL
jgi:hypothetical protein